VVVRRNDRTLANSTRAPARYWCLWCKHPVKMLGTLVVRMGSECGVISCFACRRSVSFMALSCEAKKHHSTSSVRPHPPALLHPESQVPVSPGQTSKIANRSRQVEALRVAAPLLSEGGEAGNLFSLETAQSQRGRVQQQTERSSSWPPPTLFLSAKLNTQPTGRLSVSVLVSVG